MRFPLLISVFMVLLCVGCGTETPQVIEEYVKCRSLAGDRTAIKLFAWEFKAVSDAVQSSCDVGEEFTAEELTVRVSEGLTPELRDSLQDPKSSIETTLLELEVRGVFARVADDNGGEVKLRRTL